MLEKEDIYLTQKTSVIHDMIENSENTARVPENPLVNNAGHPNTSN